MTNTEIDKGRIGSSFEDFLREEGRLDEATGQAIKRVIAWQLAQIMKDEKLSKVAMAQRMSTSRSQLDKILDPTNDQVSLSTLSKAARAVGRQLRLEFV